MDQPPRDGAALFPHLFSPLTIGRMTVANRLFTSAHNTQFVKQDPDGYHRWSVLSDRAVAYHGERARGGFGLIMVGQTQVHPQSGIDRPASYADAASDVYTRLAEVCHAHGARVVVQLNQNGREKVSSGPDSWEPVWGPSPLASPLAGARGEMCKEMDLDDIHDLVEAYARTARKVQATGVDGVEIHAAHPHLYGEWLTTALNRRTDAYGGTLENRLRIVLETVAAVRAACGREFTIGVRINGAWTMPGGQTIEEGVEIARTLEATGDIDFLNVSGWPGIGTIGSPHGNMMPWVEAVKKAVTAVPVFGLGRILDPRHAEAIVAAGKADMVGMTRASIADPELPDKARRGDLLDIRLCIGAGQGCLSRTLSGRPMTCTQNPSVGLESTWGIGTVVPAATRRFVLVVGGGPAGLEAAMMAATRGHRVELHERAAATGGQALLIGRVARRAEFLEVVHWRERRLREAGVTVRLATDVTRADVLRLRPDVVVVATGSRPRRRGWYPPQPHLDDIPGAENAPLYTVWEALEGRIDEAEHVVVVDATGYHQSGDVLEYLSARSHRVSAVTHAPLVAAGIDINDRPEFDAALRGRVCFHPSTVVERLGPSWVELRSVMSGEATRLTDVDAVVLSIGSDVEDTLFRALRDDGIEIHRIGDCVTPRGVEHAIHDGHLVGRQV